MASTSPSIGVRAGVFSTMALLFMMVAIPAPLADTPARDDEVSVVAVERPAKAEVLLPSLDSFSLPTSMTWEAKPAEELGGFSPGGVMYWFRDGNGEVKDVVVPPILSDALVSQALSVRPVTLSQMARVLTTSRDHRFTIEALASILAW